MEAKALPGTPWEGEISLGNSSGGPPEDNNEFFSAPGASGRVLGANWAPGASTLPETSGIEKKLIVIFRGASGGIS